jgi:hypothetical protein
VRTIRVMRIVKPEWLASDSRSLGSTRVVILLRLVHAAAWLGVLGSLVWNYAAVSTSRGGVLRALLGDSSPIRSNHTLMKVFWVIDIAQREPGSTR